MILKPFWKLKHFDLADQGGVITCYRQKSLLGIGGANKRFSVPVLINHEHYKYHVKSWLRQIIIITRYKMTFSILPSVSI